jgi:flagellar protein FliO/FliZ
METIFSELPVAARFFIAFLIVLLLIVLAFWLIRRFGGIALGTGAARGRQPRLAVIDAAPVDGRRRLILIRRDNVEHLLMIGGPSDIVVEQNIVRAVPVTSPREALPARPPGGLAEVMARAAEPAPSGREMPDRAPVEATGRTMEMGPPRPAEPVPPRPEPGPRPVRVFEPGARTLPAAERLGRMAAEGEMPLRPAPPIAPPPVASPMASAARSTPEPTASPETRPIPPTSDAELTDMAQRLEAALRRPMASPQPRAEPAAARTGPGPEPAPRLPSPHPFGAPPTQREPGKPREAAKPEPARSAAPEPARPSPPEPRPGTGKSVLDSLEQEMASLLGRPVGKE